MATQVPSGMRQTRQNSSLPAPYALHHARQNSACEKIVRGVDTFCPRSFQKGSSSCRLAHFVIHATCSFWFRGSRPQAFPGFTSPFAEQVVSITFVTSK